MLRLGSSGGLLLRGRGEAPLTLGRGSQGASPLLPRSAHVRKNTWVSRTVHNRRSTLLWPGQLVVPTSWVPVTSLSLRTCPPAHSPPSRPLQPRGTRDDSRGALRSTSPFRQTPVCHSSVLGHSMFTKEDGAGGRGLAVQQGLHPFQVRKPGHRETRPRVVPRSAVTQCPRPPSTQAQGSMPGGEHVLSRPMWRAAVRPHRKPRLDPPPITCWMVEQPCPAPASVPFLQPGTPPGCPATA